MQATRATRRRGPLTALDGAAPALAIGDTAVRHVRLTQDGLSVWLGDATGDFVPWTSVQAVVVEPPTTWWPHPAVGDSVGPILEGLLGGGTSETLETTPTFPVRVAAEGRDILEWRVTQHYLSGYRPRDARATTRLVDYLLDRPDSRVLLSRPTELLDRVAALIRVRPRIAE
jgi:hypothetical protein